MDILNNIHIGDQSIDDKGQVKIMDEDRLCFLVRTESRGSYGLRTISKQLLREYIVYFKLHPNNNANQAREDLCGKTDLDKFEYGYSATLMRMAKMVINPETQIIRSQLNTQCEANRHHVNFPLQQIYYGASGTGKSYEINDLTKPYSTIRTTFHPDSDYSTFVGAYKPTMEETPVYGAQGVEVAKEKRITYTFVKQAFLKAYLGAWQKYAKGGETAEPQFLVIEEINRGNCAQIFGDLFQLLDRSDNGFSTYPIEADSDLLNEIKKAFADGGEYALGNELDVNDAVDGYTSNYGGTLSDDIKNGRVLLLPNNLYIWATMNTSDQSLFPIDSAFKRRWDWQYVPIGNAGKGWTIDVNGNKYDWWQFLSAINDRVYEATYSEDKKLGYFFCKAKDGVITAEKFVSKVIFYLWNDVFKDSEFEGDAFKDANGDKLSFDKFYIAEGNKAKVNTANVEQFLKNLGLAPILTDDTEEYHGQEESKDDKENSSWTDIQRKRYEYWDAFLKYAPEKNADFAEYFGGIKKASKDHWKNFFISGIRDFYLVAIQQRRKNAIEMQVYFEETTDTYHRLYAHKEDIEQELGIKYSWEEMPDKKSSIISEEKHDVDFDNKEAWHEQFDFIIDRLLRMRETFLKYSKV